MATNRHYAPDPGLHQTESLDRKTEFPLPDRRQKRLIFSTTTGKMNLSKEVDLEDCILCFNRQKNLLGLSTFECCINFFCNFLLTELCWLLKGFCGYIDN